MKYLLITFLILMIRSTFGQETKKITEKHSNSWYTEEYYVLKADENSRHGNYKKIGNKDCIYINGYYKDNKKDSIWTEYYTWKPYKVARQGRYSNDKKNGGWIEYYPNNENNIPNCKGEYLDDAKVGIWEFRDQAGELIQKYNFTTRELLFFKPEKNIGNDYEILTDSGIVKIKLERSPMYVGGENELRMLLNSHTNYPQKAAENDISGTVLISFTIDTIGRATNHQIKQGIGGGCDEEALRVVKDFLINWIPGQLNGHPVIVKYTLPVNFKLSYQ